MLRSVLSRLSLPGTGLALSLLALPSVVEAGPNDSDWIQLFNGTDLKDWDIKFTKHALNENFNNTFKVVDGALSVDYSGWSAPFGGEFGHAINKLKPYSHYLLRVEYQVGEKQVAGGPAWAFQNNGLMLHSQPMSTMTLNQDFPISLETQLLGAGNTGADGNSTMNLCTPGTGFYTQPTGGTVNAGHCYSAATNARPAPGVWSWVSVSVLGDSIVRHYIGPSPTGTPTLTYYRPVYLKGAVTNPPADAPADGTRLTGGYIAIQAETHPYKFRKLELLNLQGCMTPANPNYKTYFVKNDPAACNSSGLGRDGRPWPAEFALSGNRVVSGSGAGAYSVEIVDMSGKVVRSLTGAGAGVRTLSVDKPGIYLVRLQSAAGAFTRRTALL